MEALDMNFDVDALPAGLLDDWEMEADIGPSDMTVDSSIPTVEELVAANASMNWMTYLTEPVATETIMNTEANPPLTDLAVISTDGVDIPETFDGDFPSSGDDTSPQRSPAGPVTPDYHVGDLTITTHPPSAIAPNLLQAVPFSAPSSLAGSFTSFQPLASAELVKKSRKRPRKRQKISHDEDAAIVGKTAVSLPREKLLTFSSADLEAFVEDFQKHRPLTKEEQKEVQRQRRLIKNRESASLSRQRKKVYINELQIHHDQLTRENEQLKAQVENLTRENMALKQEVATLQHIVGRSTLLSRLFSAATTIRKQAPTAGLSNNVKAAGVCLLIVLFSFGLLFNNASVRMGDNGPTLPFEKRIWLSLEPSPLPPTEQPHSARVFSSQDDTAIRAYTAREKPGNADYSPLLYGTNRHLLEKQTPAGDDQSDADTLESPAMRGSRTVSILTTESAANTHQLGEKEREAMDSDPEVVANVDNSPYRMIRVNSTPSEGASLKPADWRPNTTYLLCNDVQEIVPVDSDTISIDPNAPFVVALLLPPHAFGSQYQALPEGESTTEGNHMVEVTCQVLDVTYTPFDNTRFVAVPPVVSAQ